jgi:hypothetical protein
VEYFVGIARNPVLEARTERLLQAARTLSAVSGKAETLLADVSPQAKTWPHPRRVIVKAELTCLPERAARDNDVSRTMQAKEHWQEHSTCSRTLQGLRS